MTRSLSLAHASAAASPLPGQRSLAALPRGPLRPVQRALGVTRRRRDLDRSAVAEVLAREWPGLMLRKFSSDEACGDFFGRTRQTGTNWRSGHCKPDGAAVALAFMVWPDEAAGLFHAARQRAGV